MAVTINKQARAILSSLLETFDAIDGLGSIENAVAEARARLQAAKDDEVRQAQDWNARLDAMKGACLREKEACKAEVDDIKYKAQFILDTARGEAGSITDAARAEKARLENDAATVAAATVAAQDELQRVKDAISALNREREAGEAKVAAIRKTLASFQD